MKPSIRLLLKVTKVTTGHQKLPKICQNSIIISFFARRANKASDEGRSPPQELKVGPRSGPYLLVLIMIIILILMMIFPLLPLHLPCTCISSKIVLVFPMHFHYIYCDDEGQVERIEGFETPAGRQRKQKPTSLPGVMSVLGWEVWIIVNFFYC